MTRLLDESKAPILMLIAPAGYGKTTLAREWLEDRQHAWYQATNASSDVAALAAGLAEAVSPLVPGVEEELQKRLRAVPAPEAEAEALGRALARELGSWPPDAVLGIDDYHLVTTSPAAETFMAALTEHERHSLTDRGAASPELGRRAPSALRRDPGDRPDAAAMSNDEAEGVLSQSRRTEAPASLRWQRDGLR